MLITEESIAPYRRDGRKVYVNILPDSRVGTHLRPQNLTRTEDLFAEDWKKSSPFPVVAVIGYMEEVPFLHNDYHWHGMTHRCGGQTHVDFDLVATRLDVRPIMQNHFSEIGGSFYGLADGHFNVGDRTASQIVAYSNILNNIGLDCESTWGWLTEGVYPIDATQDNLDLISSAPPKLSDLTPWGENPPRFHKSCAIFLLVENSD